MSIQQIAVYSFAIIGLIFVTTILGIGLGYIASLLIWNTIILPCIKAYPWLKRMVYIITMRQGWCDYNSREINHLKECEFCSVCNWTYRCHHWRKNDIRR